MAGDTSVDEVTQRYQRQCQAYHRAPSFQLTGDVNSKVASQMLVGVVAFEIGFTGVHMSFTAIFKVVLFFILGHFSTSLVACVVGWCTACLTLIYGMQQQWQCEPDDWALIGKTYRWTVQRASEQVLMAVWNENGGIFSTAGWLTCGDDPSAGRFINSGGYVGTSDGAAHYTRFCAGSAMPQTIRLASQPRGSG